MAKRIPGLLLACFDFMLGPYVDTKNCAMSWCCKRLIPHAVVHLKKDPHIGSFNLMSEAKYFHNHDLKMAIGTCYSHDYVYIYIYALFVLAKWSIVKCRTSSWLLVDLCCFPCKDEGDQFWRCFKFPLYACSMPSNPKRCKSLRGVLMNSGDIVLHHFATFETRLWPTKMPTRIA